jgi:vitamin B12 transporter
VFTSQTRNLIEYAYLWNGETPISDLSYADYLGDTYLNIARQQIRGAEISAHYRLGRFHMRGNVTWIGGKVTFASEDIDRRYTGDHHIQPYNYGSFIDSEVETGKLIRKPQLTGFAEGGFKPLNGVILTATWRHAGTRPDVIYDPDLGPFGALGRANVDRFNLFDLGVSWQPDPVWQFALRVENIFDTSYQEIQGFQTRGRSGYLKVIFRW